MKINLITQFYLDQKRERNLENLKCLKSNLENKYINKIYVFLESNTKPDITHTKLKLVKLGRRPTFHDFFMFTNRLVNNIDIFIISNTDIYFDESISYSRRFLSKQKIFALTRWDLLRDNSIVLYNKYLSQDTWIYKSKIEKNIGNFFLGQAGCDNRLLYELKQTGLTIKNPCFSIKSVHVHMSKDRIYLDNPNYKFVDPPYHYIFPNSFYSPFRTFVMRLFDKKNYEKFEFSFSDFYYIRFEYYLKMSKNELQKMSIPIFKRILAFIPRIYYYKLFKIFKILSQ